MGEMHGVLPVVRLFLWHLQLLEHLRYEDDDVLDVVREAETGEGFGVA